MAYIKFADSKNIVKCSVIPEVDNIVTLIFPGNIIVDTSGFYVYLDDKGEVDIGGDYYLKYKTIYRNDEKMAKRNGYQLSADGSVYTQPEILPNTENYPANKELTLPELKEQKISEMNNVQQATIAAGVNVTLSNNQLEHFTLSDRDQARLFGLQARVSEGDDNIPWYTSNRDDHPKFYSNKDMKKIINAATEFIAFHEIYIRDLIIYISSLGTKEAIEVVGYGMEIPESYQSEPLKTIIAEKFK